MLFGDKICKKRGHRWENHLNTMVQCKVCGKTTVIWDALKNENHNGWAPVLDSRYSESDYYMIASNPDDYRRSDWEAAVKRLSQKHLKEVFCSQKITDPSQAKLIAEQMTDSEMILDTRDRNCKYPEALKEKFELIKRQFQNGKSQAELAAIAEKEYKLDYRLFALEKLEDQETIERIAKSGWGRESDIERIKKYISLRALAITKLSDPEAVKRAFSAYQIGAESRFDYKLPVFTEFIRKMSSFYREKQDVPCESIARLVCRVVRHNSNSQKEWIKDVREMKQMLRQYGELLLPVRDQIRTHTANYTVYPDAKVYGEGDDAFRILGDGVNIGIDIDASDI